MTPGRKQPTSEKRIQGPAGRPPCDALSKTPSQNLSFHLCRSQDRTGPASRPSGQRFKRRWDRDPPRCCGVGEPCALLLDSARKTAWPSRCPQTYASPSIPAPLAQTAASAGNPGPVTPHVPAHLRALPGLARPAPPALPARTAIRRLSRRSHRRQVWQPVPHPRGPSTAPRRSILPVAASGRP